MKSLRVLVVEDDTLIGELIGWMLEAQGHEICALETTQAGSVAAAARERPDLLIVDARLGSGSGVAAVDQILENGFIPHVYISGNVANVAALKPDAVLLQKPFGETEFLQAIDKALARGASPGA